MKFSIKNAVILGFAASVLALALAGGLAFRTTTNLVAALDRVTHTQKVLAGLAAGLATVTDAESAQRVFLLTGEEQALRDCESAQQKITEWNDQFRELIADDPGQRDRLDQLEGLIARRVALLNESIALRQREGIEAVAGGATLRAGRDLADRIRELILEMQTVEEFLLAQRRQISHANTHANLTAIVVGCLLACGVGVLAVVVIQRDLRKRERAEAEVQRTRAWLESILDNTPAVVFLKDLAGRYLVVNRRMAEIAGRPREQMLGKTAFEISPTELSRVAESHQRAVLERQGPIEVEETVLYPDGPHTHLAVKFPVRDAAGKIYALAGVSTDITARKRAEEERDRFFNLSRDLMCIAGFDGYFKTLNPAWEKTLGYTTAELLTRPFIEFVHPDDCAATLAEAERLRHGGETLNFENRYRARDGAYHWLAWSVRPHLPAGLLYASARDITGHKRDAEQIARLNQDLRQRAAQLEAANRELEAFSYSVSHDLRAPLRHIDGFVGLLVKHLGDQLDDRSRRHLKIIADAARQMGSLIDDLLVFSRMGRAELRHQEVDLTALAKEVIANLESEGRDRRIEWKLGPLPVVHADGPMLRQALANLLGNAVKYTRPRETAVIELGCTDSADDHEMVFQVRDNGVGFDMRYADKLFGVFQRLHRAEEFEGTGIGLANVRRIITRHGGRTWAESTLGEGATFFFSLPQPQSNP